jgi:hypothetical protein
MLLYIQSTIPLFNNLVFQIFYSIIELIIFHFLEIMYNLKYPTRDIESYLIVILKRSPFYMEVFLENNKRQKFYVLSSLFTLK